MVHLLTMVSCACVDMFGAPEINILPTSHLSAQLWALNCSCTVSIILCKVYVVNLYVFDHLSAAGTNCDTAWSL